MKSLFLLLLLLIVGCARAPIKSVEDSMRTASAPDVIEDDMGLFGLDQALQATIQGLRARDEKCELRFGPDSISCQAYATHLEELQTAIANDPSGNYFLKVLNEKFEYREVYGGDKWGEVFITSYFEPVIEGSLKKTKRFTQPLYGRPEDLLLIDMGRFAKTFSALREYHGSVILEKTRDGYLRGRLEKGEDGISRVVPYYSRKEIDADGVLAKKSLELIWVDPVDAFFLQIQGSGRVVLQDGSERIYGYAEQNGHPYYAIGKALKDRIPIEKMSMQKIEEELRKLSPASAQEILNQNASFVFFNKIETAPLTAMNVEAQAGRTIATDSKYFPKGALAFLEYEKPLLEEITEETKETPTRTARRFVFDHDVGGAIRGAGRVDLFWGRGEEAKNISGYMRHKGRLYYLFPRSN